MSYNASKCVSDLGFDLSRSLRVKSNGAIGILESY